MATTGTRWTKTYVDGFGRAIKTESGYNTGSTATTVSITESLNAACACTPVGKLWKTSLPYAPGGTKCWTEYSYDALGRTTQVKQPNNRGTTTYTYEGVTVKVLRPGGSGKWKRFENDAQGNLVKVTEPNPAGGTWDTTYGYSELGQLLTVNMTRGAVTQTRTWTYDSSTQRLLSVNHPESGTTSYTYNTDGSTATKTDALAQKHVYEYDADANGRLKLVKRLLTGGGEDACQRVTYYYDSQTFDSSFTANASGRVAAVATGCTGVGAGQLIEMYSYNAAGAVTKKRLRVVRGAGTADKDFTYTYGSDGKLATVLYPGSTVPFTYTYDLLDRPVKMTGPSTYNPTVTVDHAKDLVYGVAGQVTSMKYLNWEDSSTQYYFSETKTYDELFQLTRQTTTGTSGTAVDIGYEYSSTQNNGQILSRTNYQRGVVDGEKVSYQYDDLNRLVTATGTTKNSGGTTINTWGQDFVHDGFGNLLSQTPKSGYPDPSPNVSLTVAGATNRLSGANWLYDSNGNTTRMPVLGGGTADMTFDVDNRMVTWTGPASSTPETYGYLADNKRVWKKTPAGVETFYLYGLGGQKLMTCSVIASPFSLVCSMTNVYFGDKLIRAEGEPVVHDRLGSVMARGGYGAGTVSKREYFPYGDEVGTATSGNSDKFGTYHRDATTGLDYADQRYFAGTMGGKFMTPDPLASSASTSDPASWNRYTYITGDPINSNDPSGLLPAVSFGDGGGNCMLSYFAPEVIAESSMCPPGYVWMSNSGSGTSETRLQQIERVFAYSGEVLQDWDYGNSSGTRFNLQLLDAGALQYLFDQNIISTSNLLPAAAAGAGITVQAVTLTVSAIILYELVKYYNNKGKSWQVSCNGRLQKQDGTWEDVNLGWIEVGPDADRSTALEKADQELERIMTENPGKYKAKQVKHCSDPIWRRTK